MFTELSTLTKSFQTIGARVRVESRSRFSRGPMPNGFSINIQEDPQGEFFDIAISSPLPNSLEFQAVDLQKADRHLLLVVKQEDSRTAQVEKQKFLCGHDERHWFVAAVPEDVRGVTNVAKAKDALKPTAVLDALGSHHVRQKNRNRRKNKGYLRQGEWFFLPSPNIQVDPLLIVKNEPLRRSSGSKPHCIEYVYRSGGTRVYVNRSYPAGLTEREYQDHLKISPKSWKSFRVMFREPTVYAKGRVSHADHKTVYLDGWHRVLMNTENQARAKSNVAFLD